MAEKDGSSRDWAKVRELLSQCIGHLELPCPDGGGRTMHRIQPEVAAELAACSVYVEQGRSGKSDAHGRPVFERRKRDAALRKFDRLLVWKVSRLGRDMREVIATVYELADLDISVLPIRSQTGPINSKMGRLPWAIQAWFAEMENDERSDAIRAGQARARAAGKRIGRSRKVFRRDLIAEPLAGRRGASGAGALLDHERQHVQSRVTGEFRGEGLSWRKIARRTGAGVGTVYRAFRLDSSLIAPCQNCADDNL